MNNYMKNKIKVIENEIKDGNDGMTENKCRDCACFHGSTDFCIVKREKVDYLDNACEYFIWD